MGNCGSSPAETGEAKKRSQAIDKGLEEDQKRLRRECKILLLGMKLFKKSYASPKISQSLEYIKKRI